MVKDLGSGRVMGLGRRLKASRTKSASGSRLFN